MDLKSPEMSSKISSKLPLDDGLGDCRAALRNGV